ncbi:f8c22ff7-ac03-4776-9e00-372ef2d3475f [Sclerotinia trifoliorum]|uniref:F8c22ff7-ac03-4776-9e00-372ef2d3475f n=1 Tax=Sclerotinia trifoliorum TaxID=28548 RepID=A0A8H2VRJ8_9HELO|nr:f8c22ff7-ac03-4776-9e00-372ef2d3475f [Sclerotinia trifoliorum]
MLKPRLYKKLKNLVEGSRSVEQLSEMHNHLLKLARSLESFAPWKRAMGFLAGKHSCACSTPGTRGIIKFLVLSGDLEGPQYVKPKIEEQFQRNPREIAHRIRILKSQEPRLSVVKGLVISIDRRQRIKVGAATFKTRVHSTLRSERDRRRRIQV